MTLPSIPTTPSSTLLNSRPTSDYRGLVTQNFPSDTIFSQSQQGSFGFPQVRPDQVNSRRRGIASISFKGRTLRFRTNPNHFSWTYTLNHRIDNTYGGRVMQLLSTKIGDFEVEFDAGRGGWRYMMGVLSFMRDILDGQRADKLVTFEYTTRGYRFKGFLMGFPFQDSVDAVARPFTLTFKVQEDISGALSRATLATELARMQQDVGFRKSKYNMPQSEGFTNTNAPLGGGGGGFSPWQGIDMLAEKLGGYASEIVGYTDNPYGSGATGINPNLMQSGGFSGLIPGFIA